MGLKAGFQSLGRKVIDSTPFQRVWRGLRYVPRIPLAESIADISKTLSPNESLFFFNILRSQNIIHPKSQKSSINEIQFFDLRKTIPLDILHTAARKFSEGSETKIGVENFMFKILSRVKGKEVVITLEPDQTDYTVSTPNGPLKIKMVPYGAKDVLDLLDRQKTPLTKNEIFKGAHIEKKSLPKILTILISQGLVSPVYDASDKSLLLKYIPTIYLKKFKTKILIDVDNKMVPIIISEISDLKNHKSIIPVTSTGGKIIYYSKANFNKILRKDKAEGKPAKTFSEIFSRSGKKQYILTSVLEKKLREGKVILAYNTQTEEEFSVLVNIQKRFTPGVMLRKEIFDYEIKEMIVELQKRAEVDTELSNILINSADLAFKIYGNKKFPDGEMYLDHILKVAKAAIEIGGDALTVSATLLHKVEDKDIKKTKIDSQLLKKLERVIELKNKLAQLEDILYHPPPSGRFNIQNHMNMLIQAAGEGRALLLLFADKLETLRSEHRIKDDMKRKHVVREIRHIFGPLAERFGFRDLAADFYEQAFRLERPEEFARIREKFLETTGMGWMGAQTYLENLKHKFIKTLDTLEVKGRVLVRPKGYGSIYEKLQESKYGNIGELPDLLGIKIITDYKTDKIEESIMLIELALTDTLFEINTEKTHVHKKIGSHHIGIIDEEERKIEIQIMNEAEYTKEQRGLFAHWAYKLQKLTGESFDYEVFEGYADRWGDDFEENFRLVCDSINQWVYAGSIEKVDKESYIKIRRFKRGAIPIDFAASYGVDKLNEKYAGVRRGILRVDENLAFNFGPMKSVSDTEYTLQTADLLMIDSNGGRIFDISSLLRKTKHLRTKVLLLKLDEKVYNKSFKNGKSQLESIAIPQDKEFERKLGIAARKLDLRNPEELLVALGSKLIEEVDFRIIKNLLELEEVKIYCDLAKTPGPKCITIETMDRLGLLAAILSSFKDLNLIYADSKMVGPLGRRKSNIELIFSVSDKELETYEAAASAINTNIKNVPDKQINIENSIFMMVEIPAENRKRMLYNISSALSQKEINIFSVSLEVSEKDKKGSIVIGMEVPRKLKRGLQKEVIASLEKIDGVYSGEIEFVED